MGEEFRRRSAVRWAPRVPPAIVRRLYQSDASSLQDDDLVNEVGFALYARCRSIQTATSAHNGVV
ncbi:hypothetical protein ABTJ59_19995, partial [Acinetobacter baumannii]